MHPSKRKRVLSLLWRAVVYGKLTAEQERTLAAAAKGRTSRFCDRLRERWGIERQGHSARQPERPTTEELEERYGLDWAVAGKSLLWLLAAFYVLGTPLWPLSFYLLTRWVMWVVRGTRLERAGKAKEGS